MIRHFVFFTVPNDHSITDDRKVLQILTQIPHASHLEIALNRKTGKCEGALLHKSGEGIHVVNPV
ncbi:hypothetical protein [Chachezhania antarctica]|uniref:hypothetical protein n=1 Tax=Chachezhania antarctica TaxID=2340860 RepID=UPI000EB30116|nr:hypothetical protein [Chachezhania antarctica]